MVTTLNPAHILGGMNTNIPKQRPGPKPYLVSGTFIYIYINICIYTYIYIYILFSFLFFFFLGGGGESGGVLTLNLALCSVYLLCWGGGGGDGGEVIPCIPGGYDLPILQGRGVIGINKY